MPVERWGSVLITPDRLGRPGSPDQPGAGVQFSLPLIDLEGRLLRWQGRWGSVLITPDRLEVLLKRPVYQG